VYGLPPARPISFRFIRETSIPTPIRNAIALCAWAALGLSPAAGQPAPKRVEAATLHPAFWRARAELAATLRAPETATLSAARAGIIAQVEFKSGEAVRAGQVLVQLDDGPERAQLALDQARLEQAGRDAARTQKLMGISGASRAALEQAQAAVTEAKAQTQLDRANLAQLQITAPFAGTLGLRNVDPGDALQPGQAVVTLTAPGPLQVLFAVPQTEAAGLAAGQEFTLSAPSAPTDSGAPSGASALTAAGHIVALSPAQDTATDARRAEGVIDSGAALLPGMAATVQLATGAPQRALALPSTALNDDALGQFVYALQPAGSTYVVHAVYVRLLGTEGGVSYVAPKGLAAGERVVSLGGFQLTEGERVTLPAS
jgi:RND family efflux transporter MFP subunit